MSKKRRALILYSTMTKNTEKIAFWFKETFESYNWEVTCYCLKNKMDFTEMQPNVYFDDYDVVCLGSPIVGGYPLKIVSKLFSLGAHSGLEEMTTNSVNSGAKHFETPKMPLPGEAADTGAIKHDDELNWRRSKRGPFAGAIYQEQYMPLGIVFSTYGGGFYGSDECTATLEILKMFLQLNNVAVIGRFACCGKEFGPAGLLEGEKPSSFTTEEGEMLPVSDPEMYTMKDGTVVQGSYFFHYNNWLRPSSRDEAKAKALIGDIVEDYFMSYDGKRNKIGSQYISIS